MYIYSIYIRMYIHADGGHLFYIGPGGKCGRRVLFTEEDRRTAFVHCHDSPHGAHMGRDKTLEKINSRYYWAGMYKQILEWINQCERCQKFQDVKTVSPDLKPIKTSGPWELVGIDLIGPFNTTASGNRFILTCTCLWSKYAEAYAIPDKSAVTVAEKLLKMFWQYGPPAKILTDNGREFVNKCNDLLFEKFGIRHLVTLAYHPQTNGQDERTNQTLKRRLGKLCNKQQNDWDEKLEAIMFGIRTSKSASTMFTPFFLMYGREARQICELVFDNTENDIQLPGEFEVSPEDVDARVESCLNISLSVQANIDKAQERMKKSYADKARKGAKRFEFKVGDRVLYRNNRKKTRKGGQLEPDWNGPYTVEGTIGTSVSLANAHGKKISKVSSLHLKPFLSSTNSAVTAAITASTVTVPALTKPSTPSHLTAASSDTISVSGHCPTLQDSAVLSACSKTSAILTVAPTADAVPLTVASLGHVQSPKIRKRRMPEGRGSDIKRARPLKKTSPIDLSSSIRRSILNHRYWLTDEAIDCAQGILASQFPGIEGLQSTVTLAGTAAGGIHAYSER